MKSSNPIVRCWWCGDDAEYVRYHDEEWGIPVTDETALFEKLSLEGFQSGLSWLTILRKRPRFREMFEGFVPARIARFSEKDVARLLGDAGIVRHRGKIQAVIHNARAYEELVAREGSLARFVWGFAPDAAVLRRNRADIPASTPESMAMSRELKRRGWKFVGPTTAYAFFQAMGLVNDHLEDCFRQAKVEPQRLSTLTRMRR